MEIKGKLIKIMPVETVGANNFKKQSIVIETAEKYPQKISFTFLKDNVDKIAQFKPGSSVIVKFDLRGREYNGKFYNDVVGWSIVKDDSPVAIKEEYSDDIPF